MPIRHRLRTICALLLLTAGCGDTPDANGGAAVKAVASDTQPVASAVEPDSCLSYEPDTVTITGTLERRTYPGPPGYGENPDDTPETGFYIVPDAPLCTRRGSPDGSNEALSDVRLVQLVLDQDGYDRSRPWLGTRVRARGRVFQAHTGHHHAPLLVFLPAVEAVR